MRYQSFDPEAQVSGQSMLGFHQAIDRDILDPLLKKYELVNIQPEQWYLLQSWLNVLSDIDEQQGAYNTMLTFSDIGQKVGAGLLLPTAMIVEIGLVEFSKRFGEQNYLDNHQGNVGSYVVEKAADNHIIFNLRTPYPPDFWYGLLYGIARRFSKSFNVQYEDIAMRSYAADETIRIHVLIN
jgi:hypothetical protein